MSTALGDAGRERAVASIADQMRTLLASDVLYSQVAEPEINGVLADQGIEGSDVPDSLFLPDGDTSWLDEPARSTTSLGQVSGASAAATPGLHGTGLLAASSTASPSRGHPGHGHDRRAAGASTSRSRTRATPRRAASRSESRVDGGDATTEDDQLDRARRDADGHRPLTADAERRR